MNEEHYMCDEDIHLKYVELVVLPTVMGRHMMKQSHTYINMLYVEHYCSIPLIS